MASVEPTPAQPNLIFIPDISGFTQFVNTTEISHSQHIIEELLEEIIDANEIGLQISEIEGDAILFYRPGPAPTAAELLAQIQRMYVRFHAHLKKYETYRICSCGACCSTNQLSLKFILHHGELAQKHVKQYTKLFGKDLIIAHRLMKNSIPDDEYALFSHDLLNACSAWVDLKQSAWDTPKEGEDAYDSGPVQYCYVTLEALASHVPEPRVEDYGIKGASLVFEVERGVNASLENVFDVVSDVSYRHEWIPGIKGSDKLNSKITRNGSTHRCLMNDNPKDPFFISHSFDVKRDVITWVETDPRVKFSTVYTLRRIGPKLTRITYTAFVKAPFLMRKMFDLFMKKKQIAEVEGGLANLDRVCTELENTGERHANRIVLPSA